MLLKIEYAKAVIIIARANPKNCCSFLAEMPNILISIYKKDTCSTNTKAKTESI